MIPVRNVYYMLSYAFKVLSEQGYKDIETEEFQNVAELCSAILARGVALQIRRGLGREYIPLTEPLSSPRGKVEIVDTMKHFSKRRDQLVCSYDDFSVNSYMNRIIKTTIEVLLRTPITRERKKELRKLLVFFDEVDTLDIHTINWKIQYNRNNQSYRMLVSICYLVIKGLIQTKTDGSVKLMDFLDEQKMHRLYEKFILEYYRIEHPQIRANSSWIDWILDEEDSRDYLPKMQTDIMLEYKDRTLIIDAKYYGHSLQQQFDRQTVYSANLYQIFAYVKNKEAQLADSSHEPVSGMLLYAQTEEEGGFEKTYRMSGNDICVRTLDLNGDFESIRKQLDGIVHRFLNT